MTVDCPHCHCEIELLSGEPLDLTLKEHRLLVVFRERPGQLISHQELLMRVWDWPLSTVDAAKTDTIRTHIGRLRKKLKAAGYPDMFHSAHGRGWALMPPNVRESPAFSSNVSRPDVEKRGFAGTMVV